MRQLPFAIRLFLIVAFFVFLMLLWIYEGAAQEAQQYMLLYRGAHGLDFYCIDESPYTVQREMIWDAELGAIELGENGDLLAQIIEVEHCNLDNVYASSQGDYVWRFSSHNTDGHENHRHLTGGAWWIDFDYQR